MDRRTSGQLLDRWMTGTLVELIASAPGDLLGADALDRLRPAAAVPAEAAGGASAAVAAGAPRRAAGGRRLRGRGRRGRAARRRPPQLRRRQPQARAAGGARRISRRCAGSGRRPSRRELLDALGVHGAQAGGRRAGGGRPARGGARAAQLARGRRGRTWSTRRWRRPGACRTARWRRAARLVRLLAHDYPDDVGVLVALLLNHVTLAPGQAIWMPAGNLHAYLRGAGVEIMAASDNVLRGGLTPKHVNVAGAAARAALRAAARPGARPGAGGRRAWSPGPCRWTTSACTASGWTAARRRWTRRVRVPRCAWRGQSLEAEAHENVEYTTESERSIARYFRRAPRHERPQRRAPHARTHDPRDATHACRIDRPGRQRQVDVGDGARSPLVRQRSAAASTGSAPRAGASTP